MLGNTAVELAPADADAVDIVHRGFTILEQGLTIALQRARDAGEIPARGHVCAQARMLLAVLEGLQILAQTEPDPARFADAVDAALTVVTGTSAA